MSKLDKGFIQIYTGNGKGKTTAAIGQAIRAAGSGFRTHIVQFMKEFSYSEVKSLEHLKKWISIKQFCKDDFVYKKQLPDETEIEKAKRGLNSAKDKMLSGEYDIIILDEISVSIYFKLITLEAVISFVKDKPENVEIILTGRYCPPELIELADLVTEMKEVKHYYNKGIIARRGIES